MPKIDISLGIIALLSVLSPAKESVTNFDSLLSELEPYIKRSSKGFSGSVGDGSEDDFAQEARIRLLTAFRSQPKKELPYFKLTAKNAMRDHYDREKRHGVSQVESVDENFEYTDGTDEASFVDGLSIRVSVQAWVNLLPRTLRNVYNLIYVRGLTQREAATKLKLSQSRIAQLHAELLSIGRDQLRSLDC